MADDLTRILGDEGQDELVILSQLVHKLRLRRSAEGVRNDTVNGGSIRLAFTPNDHEGSDIKRSVSGKAEI